MKKLIFLLITSVFFASCNTDSPKTVAETMLKLSVDGEFPTNVYDMDFKYFHSFTYYPFVEELIIDYGTEALNMAEQVSQNLITLPNNIESFEFIEMVKQDSQVIKSIQPFRSVDGRWMSEDEKNFYVKNCNGIIDYKKQLVIYDVSHKAAKTMLVYKVTSLGNSKELIFGMVSYFGDWEIYAIAPKLENY